MPKAQERDPIYRHRRFPAEVIETCVRWYITYRLSYRDMVAMMAERGVTVSHTTIMRWVLRYVPEYEARWGRYAKPVHGSWRMDETAVRVRGGNHYLYRAVDKHGKSVDSVLCAGRDRAAAQAFFEHAAGRRESGWPDKINVDGYTATHLALRNLGKKDRRWRSVEVRSNRYLNNIVEQDHRAIKRRCASMLGMKSFRSAAITLAGIELAHRIRKRQFSLPSGCERPARIAEGVVGPRAAHRVGQVPYPKPAGLTQTANAPELKQESAASVPQGASRISGPALFAKGHRRAWPIPSARAARRVNIGGTTTPSRKAQDFGIGRIPRCTRCIGKEAPSGGQKTVGAGDGSHDQ
jgi:transposase-like protein